MPVVSARLAPCRRRGTRGPGHVAPAAAGRVASGERGGESRSARRSRAPSGRGGRGGAGAPGSSWCCRDEATRRRLAQLVARRRRARDRALSLAPRRAPESRSGRARDGSRARGDGDPAGVVAVGTLGRPAIADALRALRRRRPRRGPARARRVHRRARAQRLRAPARSARGHARGVGQRARLRLRERSCVRRCPTPNSSPSSSTSTPPGRHNRPRMLDPFNP